MKFGEGPDLLLRSGTNCSYQSEAASPTNLNTKPSQAETLETRLGRTRHHLISADFSEKCVVNEPRCDYVHKRKLNSQKCLRTFCC